MKKIQYFPLFNKFFLVAIIYWQATGGFMEKINCMQCKYYVTTWDKNAPRGCSVYGIKTATIPSFLVKKESGHDCMSYEQKAHFKKDKEDKVNFNDAKYW